MHSIATTARVVLALTCFVAASVRPALAQGSDPRRPSGGLFGPTRSDVNKTEKLNFTFELAEGLDSDVPSQGGAVVGGRLGASGFSTLFGATSTYAHNSRRLEVGGSASTAFKYYQQLDRLDALSHGASLGVRLRLPKQGQFEINQAAAYSPSYLYQLFPQVDSPSLGESIPLNPDYRIDDTNSVTYETRGAVRFGSLRGTQLTASGEYRVTDYDNETPAQPGLETRAGGAQVSHALSRSASFVLGYRYQTGKFDFHAPSQEHQATIGVEFSPALSVSRRLNIRLNASPAWFKVPPPPVDNSMTPFDDGYLYGLQGNVEVGYPFRPNWRVAASYYREVEYLVGVSAPLLTDGVRAALDGLISRQIDLAASVGYVSAVSAVPGADQDLHTYTGTVKLRYALRRSIAVYSEYLYYYYDQRGQRLAPGLPGLFEQHGVRIGLTLFAEALGR